MKTVLVDLALNLLATPLAITVLFYQGLAECGLFFCQPFIFVLIGDDIFLFTILRIKVKE